MSQESITDFLPLWLLVFSAFGFMLGEPCEGLQRTWKCLEQVNVAVRVRFDKCFNQ